MGLSAGFERIDAGFSHSILLTVSDGGPTAAMYEWGAIIQAAHGSGKVVDKTLTHIGYFTDDGAYYCEQEQDSCSLPCPPATGARSPLTAALGSALRHVYADQWQPFPAKMPGTFINATREWPAEVGLVKVKEALYAHGVPIAYMQLGKKPAEAPFPE